MKSIFRALFLFFLASSPSWATPITLDFSSGEYDAWNTRYEEQGYVVTASHGFHSVMLNTLAWYEGDNIISIESDTGDPFDLLSLTIVNRAFAGLEFVSSKGGVLSVGSISGELLFSGDLWQGIDYLTVASITHFDVLNQIDNIRLATFESAPVNAVPEPGTLLLVLSVFLACVTKVTKRLSSSLFKLSWKQSARCCA